MSAEGRPLHTASCCLMHVAAVRLLWTGVRLFCTAMHLCCCSAKKSTCARQFWKPPSLLLKILVPEHAWTSITAPFPPSLISRHRENADLDNIKNLIDEATFYDKQWNATWEGQVRPSERQQQ